MKQFISSVVIILAILLPTQVSAHTFEGNWYFLKGEYKQADGTILKADNSSLVAVKSIKGDIFSLTNSENGVFLGYLAGEFLVDGDNYTEAVKTGTRAKHHGKNYHFKGWLETSEENGQTVTYWHHEGEVDGVKEYEVWRKLL